MSASAGSGAWPYSVQNDIPEPQPEPRTGPLRAGLRGEQVVVRGIRSQFTDRLAHLRVHRITASADSERCALDDGSPDEPLGAFGDEHVRDRVAARGVTADRHGIGVAAEPGDVVAHPAQRLDDVEQSEVRRVPLPRVVADEAEQAEPIGHRDDDDAVLAHERRRVEAGQVARVRDVRAAVDAHEHRQRALDLGGAGDREAQAVLIEPGADQRVAEHLCAGARRLRARDGRELQFGRLAGIRIDRLRRREPIGAGIADVAESDDPVGFDRRELAPRRLDTDEVGLAFGEVGHLTDSAPDREWMWSRITTPTCDRSPCGR